MDSQKKPMDAKTRARYEAWMWQKIIRKVVVPGALIIAIIITFIMGVNACVSNNRTETTYLPTTGPADNDYNEDDQDYAYNQGDYEQTITVSSRTTYQDFDFAVYNEDLIEEINASDLYSYTVLVNKVFRLPKYFSPTDLVVPNVLAVWDQQNVTLRMRESAARALEDLFNAAYDEEEIVLWAVSAYRSYDDQVANHQRFIDQHGYEKAERMSARPGHSEHQTGLAMDVTAYSSGGHLTQSFYNTEEGIWLRENAHRFGFIIRYPYGKLDLTGIEFEPWHIRYVGRSTATSIFRNGLVLEQYVLPMPTWDQP